MPPANMPQPQPTGWRVLGQAPSTQADQTGRFVRGMIIQFVTATGVNGEVFVPDSVYGNTDTVRQIIAQKAASIDAVANLGG